MTKQERFTQIAKRHLGIETLVTSNSSADFHEVATWTVTAALDAAYRAGLTEMLDVMEAVDALWRKHGVGDDDAESEPIWNALQTALAKARRNA